MNDLNRLNGWNFFSSLDFEPIRQAQGMPGTLNRLKVLNGWNDLNCLNVLNHVECVATAVSERLIRLKGLTPAMHVTGRERVREIPKGQRLIGRASLKKLFDGAGKGKTKRDRMIAKAVNEHGYSQMEVARHLKLHYSSISRLVKGVNEEQR